MLDFGRVLIEGTPDEIRTSPEVQAAYFGAPLEGRASAHDHGGATSREHRHVPLLEVTDLEVAYGEARALFGVSFSVPRGSVTAVLGANGAGKSSLAAAIAGVVHPSAGRSRSTARTSPASRRTRSPSWGSPTCPRSRNLFPHLSVKENLWAQLRFSLPRAQRKDAFDRAMEMFPILAERRTAGCGHALRRRAADAGAGARAGGVAEAAHRRRDVARARAPIVDLVFESLDAARDDGVTVLLIEQFVERALGFADQAVVLRHGLVGWQGAAADAGDELLAEYLGGETASTI